MVVVVSMAILAPGRSASAQEIGATPVTADQTPVVPDDSAEPAMPASIQSDGLVGPMMVSGLAFDRSDYPLTMGASVTATLTISMTGPTTNGTTTISLSPNMPPMTMTATGTPAGDPGATCNAFPAPPGLPATVQFSSPGALPATCTVSLLISGATLPGFTFSLSASATSLENPILTSAFATVSVVPASTETLTVAVDRATAMPGDTVTVTASQQDQAIMPFAGSIIGGVPVGTTLVPGSGAIACAPMCISQFTSELPNQVTGTYFPLPGTPLTATLIYQVRINDDIAPGTVLTITSQGSTGLQTPTGPATATVTVLAPLSATDASFDVPHGGTITESVSATGGIAPITYSLVTAPTKGTIVLNANGSFIYTASADEAGTDTFDFLAQDASSTTDTGTITFTIADPPLVVADNTLVVPFEGNADGAVTASGGAAPYTFAVDTAPAKGTVTLNDDGTFTYSANAGETGADSFTVLVQDAGEPRQEAVATVDVTILPEALAVEGLSLTVMAGETVTGDLSDQVRGGVPPYTFAVDTAPSQGTLALNPDGTFTYIANDDATGMDSFTYTVTDSDEQEGPVLLAVTTGTVDITFAAQPVTPTPTTEPTVAPSPTVAPTATPSPTVEPTVEPTVAPTTAPAPTVAPTQEPTAAPDPTPTATPPVATTLPSTGTGADSGPWTLAWLLLGSPVVVAAGALGWQRRTR
ncbi:MAG TPA: Ig-like domain-containing protein [Thermomicrobiales bacterium]|nr:Ig-like domain-containing protein [Thermomicrobiales bacterium]